MKTCIHNCSLFIGEAMMSGWVLFEDDLILGTGDEKTPIPEADAFIDAGGASVLPGLFNLHVHIQRRHLSRPSGPSVFRESAPAVENSPDTFRMVHAVKNAWSELLRGVTVIRDCGSKNRINIALREMISRQIVGGPKVLACGFGVAATGGHETHRYQGAVEADGPYEIRKAVRGELKAGADFIKFMGSGGIGGMPEHEDPSWIEMDEDELRAGITEAHRRGKKTAVHAMGEAAVLTALKAGIDSIEHGVCLSNEAIERMAEAGTAFVPTISGITAVASREQEFGSRQLGDLITQRVVVPLQESIRRAADAGLLIGCGTDTFGDVTQELELLHQCGLSRIDCLLAAGSRAAEICGLENSHGSLEKGKQADIVLVRGNPLEDLGVLRQVELVIKSGIRVEYPWLAGMIQD